MPTVAASELTQVANDIFTAAGASAEEARVVADALVGANLAGHDSHGVMRIPNYVRWIEKGLVHLGAELEVVVETEAFLTVDGNWGFGQVMGRKAMRLAIDKAAKAGAVTMAGRQMCHMGRLGDYPRMAADKGMAAAMFVNTHGAGRLVAPWGGIERRLSANPIAIGLPWREGNPIVVDVSTCTIAEGKVRNMRTAKTPVPEGCIIDADGNPTTDADAFYGPPPGALLPVGGHKGFALGLAADILAGAISGAGCTRAGVDRIGNGFLITVIDIERVSGRSAFEEEVRNLVAYVKSSKLAPGFSEILVPGEPEARQEDSRSKNGIPIHDETWSRIIETAKRHGVEIG